MMIDLQLLIKNPALQEILKDNYIKRDVNGVSYTIGGQPTVDKIQKNLIGRTKNA